MQNVAIRPASLNDLPALTEIHNYYVLNTHFTFDIQPFSTDQRRSWFHNRCDERRYQLLVAEDRALDVLGYACTGRFRPKEAYSTTVEAAWLVVRMPWGAASEVCYTQLCLPRSPVGISIASWPVSRNQTRFPQTASALRLQEHRDLHSGRTKIDKYWDVTWMERPLMLNTHSPDE